MVPEKKSSTPVATPDQRRCAAQGCAPPHSGRLHYENYPWGMSAGRFRALAAEALRELGIGAPP